MQPAGVIIPAVLIVAIGGGIGLADLAMRKDKVKLDRPEPPPLDLVLPPVKPTPAGKATNPQPASTQTSPDVDVKTEATSDPAAAAAPIAESARTPPAAPTATPPAALPKGHITVPQAAALYDQQAFFVDSRRKDVYVAGHVAGAFRADMVSFKAGDPMWVRGLPKEMILVVYCDGGDCDESEHVAQLLNASGFNAVYVMHDGFPGWKDAGHPVETGEGQE